MRSQLLLEGRRYFTEILGAWTHRQSSYQVIAVWTWNRWIRFVRVDKKVSICTWNRMKYSLFHLYSIVLILTRTWVTYLFKLRIADLFVCSWWNRHLCIANKSDMSCLPKALLFGQRFSLFIELRPRLICIENLRLVVSWCWCHMFVRVFSENRSPRFTNNLLWFFFFEMPRRTHRHVPRLQARLWCLVFILIHPRAKRLLYYRRKCLHVLVRTNGNQSIRVQKLLTSLLLLVSAQVWRISFEFQIVCLDLAPV